MIKTILQIKETYLGNFELQEILLLNLLSKTTSDINDWPVLIATSKKGTVYDR